MQTVVLAIQIISCVVLIVVVLMQAGKEGMGVIFGGGSGSVFGSSGAGGLLVRITVIAAIVFLASTVFYNALIAKPVQESSVVTTTDLESGRVSNATPGALIEDPGIIPNSTTPAANETFTPAVAANASTVESAANSSAAKPAANASRPEAVTTPNAASGQNSSTSATESNKTD